MTEDRILRRRETLALIGLSRSTLYEYMKIGQFPRPVKLGQRAVGWRLSSVDAWLSSRPVATGSVKIRYPKNFSLTAIKVKE